MTFKSVFFNDQRLLYIFIFIQQFDNFLYKSFCGGVKRILKILRYFYYDVVELFYITNAVSQNAVHRMQFTFAVSNFR